MNEIVRRASIEELCRNRTKALELYAQGVATLHEAMKAHGSSLPIGRSYPSIPDPLGGFLRYNGGASVLEFSATMRQNIDRDMWKSLIEFVGIGALMDRQERERFNKEVEASPPEFTPETVLATLDRLRAEGDAIFRRGLVNAFSKLCRDYKSNDGFKIGERTVITFGVTFDKHLNWFSFCSYAEENLRDVDRVMYILDGKPTPDSKQGQRRQALDEDKPAPEYTPDLRQALGEAMRAYRRGGPTEVTTDYWRAKFFKNGNIHLWCLRDDLRAKANKIIAEHYGEVLPAGPGATKTDPFADIGHREFRADDQDFIPTPPELVEIVVREAEIEPGMLVLEPEAGEGALAAAARALTNQLTCFEINPERAARLKADGFVVINDDFLKMTPEARYDRIVMNPPFSHEQDVMHVVHALRFLKSGGRLVAIMAQRVLTSSSKRTVGFREIVELCGGTITELPEGSFKSSGTNVRTVLVVIDKP